MLRIEGTAQRHCDRLSRREMLRIGGVGLGGLSLPALLQHRAQGHVNPAAKAKSVIVLFHSGGVGQHETWDPKPEGPTETRGAFGAIQTKTPGLLVGELMPKLASMTDKLAVIRSMVTGDNAHSTSGYQMLTGMPHAPLNRENAPPGRPNDWPSLNGIVQALRPSNDGIPSSIALPRRLANNNGQDPWPGTDAGFLGRKHDPWLLECDPNDPKFTVPGGALPEEVSTVRLHHRSSLLAQLNDHVAGIEKSAAGKNYDQYKQQAIKLVAGGKARDAFDLSKEPAEFRDRYGRHKYGQSVLLARRLVETGVSLVQVQWTSVVGKDKPNGGGWDTHEKHNESIKGWLVPVMDQVTSTLLLDLEERGMLDETLVCIVTEFGHTPKFNAKGGRDHWGRVFSIALAGGGIRGGVFLGRSDRNAAEPVSDITRPADYLATVYHLLGYDSHTIVHDIQNRPFPITRGRVIEEIIA
ncbi:DUF1501 domain-containing protein [Anatilimnocola sp. NA78]|uniref:DUF1501 domain-containing protein n=1 Tax=Anatilimnocola sp. NA78 TaxID=3415683 RepID=UPI003CE5690E